jgi:hypothetical protein
LPENVIENMNPERLAEIENRRQQEAAQEVAGRDLGQLNAEVPE